MSRPTLPPASDFPEIRGEMQTYYRRDDVPAEIGGKLPDRMRTTEKGAAEDPRIAKYYTTTPPDPGGKSTSSKPAGSKPAAGGK